MNATELRNLIDRIGKVDACQQVAKTGNEAEADAWLMTQIMSLLADGKYAAAGTIIWGNRLFNPRPIMVKKVWQALNKHAKNLLQGSSAEGKSYSAIVWHLLDFWRDPYFTNIKLISTTAGHAKGNTYGTMAGLFRQAIITMPGVVLSDYMGMDPSERTNGISIVAIPDGDDGGKVLQGFHPLPRENPHPKLGDSSRVRAMIDEAELVPGSIWDTGVKNMLASQHGPDSVKVTAAYNPNDISSRVASISAPEGGHDMIDADTGYEGSDNWISKDGWNVTRLDAAKSENVMQRKLIFPGFQTYEGYLEVMEPNDGNTPEAWSFGRGLYPPTSSIQIIIPSKFIETSRGEFEFIGSTVGAGGADIAVEGRDDAIFTAGRYGTATAFNRLVINKTTRKREYDRIPFTHPRKVAQADQQFILAKGTTKIVADSIKNTSLSLGIDPEWVCMDRTGNGGVPHDYLCIPEVWGPVQGLDFNKPATETKILDEDKFTAEERFDGSVTEVWFAMSLWMEFGYLALSPAIPSDPLEQELRSRRYMLAGKKRRVEKKDDFKGRFGRSPDRADSLSLFLHAVRMKARVLGSMTGRSAKPDESRLIKHSPVDVVKWIN